VRHPHIRWRRMADSFFNPSLNKLADASNASGEQSITVASA
jgi:hypothetical protein